MTKDVRLIYRVAIILAATLVTLLATSAILLLLGANVAKTFVVIFLHPLSSKLQITEVILRAIPLSIIALGISVAYRCGIINIGAEGQMMVGILGTTITALLFPALPPLLLIPLALLVGGIFGGLWALIAGLLRAKLEVSELLSTVMLNYIAAQLYTFMLRGPLLDPVERSLGGGGNPQSMRLSQNLWLTRLIPRTRLHSGLFIALALALVIYLLLYRSDWGFKMRASGFSARAARYGGINVGWYLVLSMFISGAFAGIAGGIEVAGVHRRALEGISSGYGFSAIVVALFGGLSPAGIIPASLFFGLLIVGSDMTQRLVGVPANMVGVLQGVIILAIVSTKTILADPYLAQRFWRMWKSRFPKTQEGRR